MTGCSLPVRRNFRCSRYYANSIRHLFPEKTVGR